MRADVPVHLVSDVEAFPACPFIEDSHKQVGSCKISHDGSWAWIVRNSVLEIFSTQKVERKSYWSFRTDQKSSGIAITSVTEFYSNVSSPQLIILLDVANLLCLFDVNSSTVIRAVHLPFQIESVEVVATRGGACIQTRPLATELRYMFGIVAVAVEGGHIFLVDLCLDEDSGYTNETQPGEPFFASTTTLDLAQKRETAVNSFEHMTLNLNEDHFHRGNFLYRGPEDEVITAFNTSMVSITSMKYIPHLTLLVVGFNFGGFQLWNLQKLLLDYSSSVNSDSDPVVKFAFQEPENDPRNYCYLWVVKGQSINDLVNPNITSVATLYSLGYQKKEWIENYGFIYQGMQNCVHRLSYPLTTQPLDINFPASYGSRIISFHCIQQGEIINLPRADLEELHGDDFANQDLSLCIIVWEAWTVMSNPAYFLALFDINQWYQAQMPSSIRCLKNGQCSYFGVFSLLEVKEKIKNSNLLDVHICPSSFVKHKSLSSSDEMYFPSSLAFKALCASECGILKVSYLGTQRQVLWEMEELGPNSLINPTNLYNLCVSSSLLPVSTEVSGNVILKREALLTLALNYNLCKFITSCICQWSSVDYSKNGLTLKFLLNWIWKRVTLIKNSTDKICGPLFNHSGQELEQNSLTLLHIHSTQLERLSLLLKIMSNQTGPITETGLQELQTRQEVTQLISTYLRVILWLYYCSLLPEHAEGEAYGENEVAYPASTLFNTYSQRRKDLQLLHSSVGQTDLLLIDGMLTHFGELPLQWEKGTSRFYPPPSLYALLGIYLVKGPPLEDKHCLMLYLLLDMAAFLSDKQSHLEEKLMKFPAAFKMSHSRVKLTQGFWMLDHRDFEEAILFFTDPVIVPSDILPWQHLRILKSFLYQGEHQKALKYIQICKPSLQTPEEVKMHLTILLANKLIVEAFQYQRQCCDERNNDYLLTHFFMGCQQTGNMDALLQLPFSALEEEALIQFLFNSRESFHKDLLVMYFLQRSQPLEASHVNERIKLPLMDSDSQSKERTTIRSSLVAGFLQTLPEMQSRLATEVGRHHAKMTSTLSNATCPMPLSTQVHHNTVNVLTQSSRLYDLMSRVKDTWSLNQMVEQSPLRSNNRHESVVWRSEGIPFIETPGTQRKLKRLESEVIFATPLSKRKLSMDFTDSNKTSTKKFKGLDPFNPQSRGDFEKSFNFSKHQRPISSEVLSLLQTPPIKKIIPPIRAQTLERVKTLASDTPPSILKIRQLIRRSATPPNLEKVSRTLTFPGTESSDDNEDTESGKNLRFDMSGASKGSVTASEWSTTPDRTSEPEIVQPGSSNRGSFNRSRLNLTGNSSFLGQSLHNSDEIIDEDEEITVNFSIQNRRDISLVHGKEVSFAKPHLPKPAIRREALLEHIPQSPVTPRNILKGVAATSPNRDAPVLFNIEPSPPKDQGTLETSPLVPTPRPQLSSSKKVPVEPSSFASTPVIQEPVVNESDDDDDVLRLSESDDEPEMEQEEEEVVEDVADHVPPSPSPSPSPQRIDSDDEGIGDNYPGEPIAKTEGDHFPSEPAETEERIGDNYPSEAAETEERIGDNYPSKPAETEERIGDNYPSEHFEIHDEVSNESDVKSPPKVSFFATHSDFKDIPPISEHIVQIPQEDSNLKPIDKEITPVVSFSSVHSVIKDDVSKYETDSVLSTTKDDIEEDEQPQKVSVSFEKIKTAKDELQEAVAVAVASTSIMAEEMEILKPLDEEETRLSMKEDEENQMEKSIEAAKSLLSDAFQSAQVIGSDSKKRITKVKSLSSLDSSLASTSQEKPKLTRQTRSLRSMKKDSRSEDESDVSVASTSNTTSYAQKGFKGNKGKTQKGTKKVTKESEESDSSIILRSSKVVMKGISTRSGSKKKDAADESVAPVSPTPSSDASSTVFISPEKQTTAQWAPRLRHRSRGDSVSSLDSSPPNITKELGAKPKTTKLVSIKSTTSKETDPVLETSIQKRGRRKTKKSDNEAVTSHSISVIPEDSILESSTTVTQATALPFVFSPPATRSRTRRKKSDSFSEQTSLYEAPSVLESSKMDESVTTRSKKTGPIPPWECFINVISPPPPSVKELEDDSSKKTRTSSSGSSLSLRHGMQLRKGPFKTRKKVNL